MNWKSDERHIVIEEKFVTAVVRSTKDGGFKLIVSPKPVTPSFAHVKISTWKKFVTRLESEVTFFATEDEAKQAGEKAVKEIMGESEAMIQSVIAHQTAICQERGHKPGWIFHQVKNVFNYEIAQQYCGK